MADSSSSGPPEKKELSVETRLLLAFILMGAVCPLRPISLIPIFVRGACKKRRAGCRPETLPGSSGCHHPTATPGQDLRRARRRSRSTPISTTSSSNRGAGLKLTEEWARTRMAASIVNTAAAPSSGILFTL